MERHCSQPLRKNGARSRSIDYKWSALPLLFSRIESAPAPIFFKYNALPLATPVLFFNWSALSSKESRMQTMLGVGALSTLWQLVGVRQRYFFLHFFAILCIFCC